MILESSCNTYPTVMLWGNLRKHDSKYDARATVNVCIHWQSLNGVLPMQSTRFLPDAQADSKVLKCVRTSMFDCRTLSWTIRALPGEKYVAAQLNFKVLYPPVHSVTNDCACRTVQLKTVPRVTSLHAHAGSHWHSPKKPIWTNNQSMQCHAWQLLMWGPRPSGS